MGYVIALVDELAHDAAVAAVEHSVVMIDSTHGAVAYQGASSDGYISTFSIDAGADTITIIDTLEHDTTDGGESSLILVDATHLLLAYSGAGQDGYVKTFSIDGSYDNITEIESLEYDTSVGGNPSIVLIDSTHFAIAYKGDANDGWIKTFSMDGSFGTLTELDAYEFDTVLGVWNSLLLVDSTHLIVAYAGSGLDGFIQTFSIDGSFVITSVDTLEHETSDGLHNSLVKIDATHYALAYRGVGSDGFIATFSIDGSADNITEIDSLEHDITSGDYNSIELVDSTHLIVAYRGGGSINTVKTFSFDGSYSTLTEIDSYTLSETGGGGYLSIDKIDSTHFVVAWTNSLGDAVLTTIELGDGAGGGPANIKTVNEIVIANVKTMNEVAIASVKTINEIA